MTKEFWLTRCVSCGHTVHLDHPDKEGMVELIEESAFDHHLRTLGRVPMSELVTYGLNAIYEMIVAD